MQLEDDLKRVTSCISESDNQVKKLKNQRKSLNSRVKATRKEILQRYEELRSILDSQQIQLMAELDSYHKKKLKELATTIIDIQKQSLIMHTFKDYVKEIKDKKKPSEISGVAVDLHVRANEMVAILKEYNVKTRHLPVDITFAPSHVAKDSSLIGKICFEVVISTYSLNFKFEQVC